MKFGFFTLGCKVNQFETQALEQLAASRGYQICRQDADAFIINTCTVTSVSDHKNIRAIHKIKKENPRAVIAVCGCFAQTNPQKLEEMPEIDIICGTSNRASVLDLCIDAIQNHKKRITVTQVAGRRPFESLPAGILAGRTRALLKVQDGCDNYCTYCIIPYARGHVRSMPLKAAVSEAIRLSQSGVSEIVLTGIEISSYGTDLENKTDLTGLIDAICTAVPNTRIRLSSLEPRTITKDFCTTLAKYENLARHFHLSLQSGCDNVLSRMKRRYRTDEYFSFVSMLRTYFPDCSVTTDLIVGFPGETEEEFEDTLSFVQKCSFASMHVFPYSVRSGTPAAAMSDQLATSVKTERANRAKAIAKEMEHTFLKKFIGQEIEILLEHCTGDFWIGHSKWHFPVKVKTGAGKKNKRISVRLTVLDGTDIIGEEC